MHQRESGPEEQKAYVELLEARRASSESLVWEAPSLALAAQAFLLTIALGAGATLAARMIACILSLVASLMAFQLMARAAYRAGEEDALLTKLHERLGLESPRIDFSKAVHWWTRMSSFDVWRAGLLFFALTAVAILVLLSAYPDPIVGPRAD